MADWPFNIDSAQVKCYPTGASTYNTQVQTNSSANTKGSWTELVASTPFDGFLEILISAHIQQYDHLYDVAIGAASSEQAIIENVLFSCANTVQTRIVHRVILPVLVPSGTRISMRAQSAYSGTTSIYAAVMCHRIGSMTGVQHYTKIDTYGADTADSGGTAIDPGGTANTKGSYVQLTSSLDRDIKGFFLCIGCRRELVRANAYWKYDVAVGAASSEEDIVSDSPMAVHSNNELVNPVISPIYWIAVSSGTRMSMRAQCSLTNVDDRQFDAILYAIS